MMKEKDVNIQCINDYIKWNRQTILSKQNCSSDYKHIRKMQSNVSLNF